MDCWILFKRNWRKSETEWTPSINRLMKYASEYNINAYVISPDDIDVQVSQTIQSTIRIKGKNFQPPKFIIARMGGHVDYHSLFTIRFLEKMEIPVVNSYSSINIARDKWFTQQFLSEHNIPMLKTLLVKYPVDLDYIEANFEYPVILKTVYSAKANGVYLCENQEQLINFLDFYRTARAPTPFIIQEFIAESAGRDVRVYVLGNKVVASMYRTGRSGSFKSNYSIGGKVEPFKVPPDLEDLALKIVSLIGLESGSADFLLGNEGYKLCEVNATPGFKGLEDANPNLNLSKHFFDYLIERYGK